jgi:hypothetical protein
MMFLDIGSTSIKMVEINRLPDRVQITKAVTIPNASRYLSSFGIEDLDGLLACIVKAAEEEQITAKRVYVVSSALGIQSKLEISEEATKGREGEKSNTKITSTQLYGSLVYDDKTTMHSVVSTGNIYVLRSLAQAFAMLGYTVVSIEDSLTTTMNLVRLNKYTYNYPGKVIVSFGHKTEFICYNKDVPVSITEFERKISEMIDAIAESAQMDPAEIDELFCRYGLIKSQESVEYLIHHGIHPNSYFDVVRSSCAQFLAGLKEAIDAEADSMQIGRCHVIVTGGFADVPGMYEMLEKEFTDESMIVLRNAIPRSYENDYILIQNKSGLPDIGATYGNCTGLLLKDMFKTTVNLLPAKSAKVDNKENLATALKTMMKVAGAVCGCCTAVLLATAIRYTLTKEPADTTALVRQYEAMQVQEDDFNLQLDTLKKIDKTGSNLLKYVSSYTDTDIRVISIDTQDMVTSQEDTAAVSSEDTQSESSEAAGETTVKQYIIRGYAARASAATKFYNSILDAGYKNNATMADGLRSVTLPSNETMYIFEIYVNVGT